MKRGISTAAAVVVTMIIMGAGIFAGYNYLTQQKEKQVNNKQSEISELTKQVNELKDQVASNASGSGNSATDTTANNKAGDVLKTYTYTSTKYGYSFKYLSTYSLVDWLWDGQNNARVPQKGGVVWVSKTALSEKAIPMNADPISQYFSVSVTEDLYGLSAIRGDGTGVTINDVTMAGSSAWKVTTTVKDEFTEQFTTTYYINHGDYGYALRIVNSDAAGTHDAEIDDIVESFKFL